MTKTIIGLTGRKQSGKTTAAKHLVEKGFARMSFAAPIRNMIGDFLLDMGYAPDYVDVLLTEDKEQILAPLGKSPRQLMQSLGTEWGRDCVHDDVWVRLARRSIVRSDDYLVFDDVRFENEASMIRSLGGLIIHIERDDLPADRHASEHGINNHVSDQVVNNNGSLDAFLFNINLIVSGRLAA